jgi:hypothetical protein
MTKPAVAWIACALFISAPALAATISPSEADAHIGQIAIIEGIVSEVHFDRRSGTTFIDLGGHYPANTFSGVIFARSRAAFPDVPTLEGRTVDISGKIDRSRGKPEIILTSPGQLKPTD